MNAMQNSGSYLSSRIAAEWEAIGLLLALSLVWRLLVTIGAGSLLATVFHFEAITPFPDYWLRAAVTLGVILAFLSITKTALFVRNRTMARDVAMAARLTESDTTQAIPKPDEQPPCIAFDFDGVIADTNGAKAERYEKVTGGKIDYRWCSRTLFKEYGAKCKPKKPHTESLYKEISKVSETWKSTLDLSPVLDAVESLEEFAKRGWRLVCITYRTDHRLLAAQRWLHDRLKNIDFVTLSSLPSGLPKWQIALNLGARAFVDDDPRHLETILPSKEGEKAIKLILFDSPNESAADYESFLKARSWVEVQKLVHLKP